MTTWSPSRTASHSAEVSMSSMFSTMSVSLTPESTLVEARSSAIFAPLRARGTDSAAVKRRCERSPCSKTA